MKKKTMKTLNTTVISAALVASVLSGPALAETVHYTTISDIGTSPKTISIGHVKGFSESADVIFENPASIKSVENNLSLFQASLSDSDAEVLNAAMSFQLSDTTSMAVGYVSERSADASVTEESGDEFAATSSSFGYSSSELYVGMGVNLSDRFSVGIGVNTYQKEINNVSGDAMDYSVGLRLDTQRGVLSASAKNISESDVTYSNDSTETLASTYELAYATRFNTEFPVRLFLHASQDSEIEEIRKGLGLSFYPMKDDRFIINVGAKESKQSVDSGQYSLTAGFGLNLGPLHLNYAYDQSEVEGSEDQHYFGINLDY